MGTRGLILGIESSCDETAAAVVERGARTLSSAVASQIATHARYGGVVPELASREHLRAIVPVVRAALTQANITLADLDAIAVTNGPGLAGALLVGITYAKALAFANRLPLIAVNHLEGHIHAVLLNEREAEHGIGNVESQVSKARPGPPEESSRTADEPALALVVSGGHTHLFLARPTETAWTYKLIGRTLDDAAGEAYDKVAKLLGLGYPGGPWIDALALHGNARAVPFAFSQIKTKVHLGGKAPRTKAAKTAPIANLDPRFLFSFSGIKTAVLRYVELHNLRPEAESRREALFTGPDAPAHPTIEDALAQCDPQTLDLIASFQYAVVGDLMKKTFAAAESLGARRILVTGGVAANRSLRARFAAEAARRNVHVAFPTLALSTDNAAMIAAAAWPKLLAKEFADSFLSADPSLALGR
ncbi:MAG: tRNA (adenosine(37)-N6)-threonylcarbamoyltransferase complex transferase subunit TsaD [Terracidiphilus sp.]